MGHGGQRGGGGEGEIIWNPRLDERNKKSTAWKRKDGGKYARTRWRSAKTNEEITNEGEDGGRQCEKRRRRKKKKIWGTRKERNMKGTRGLKSIECARQFEVSGALPTMEGNDDEGKVKETWKGWEVTRLEIKRRDSWWWHFLKRRIWAKKSLWDAWIKIKCKLYFYGS